MNESFEREWGRSFAVMGAWLLCWVCMVLAGISLAQMSYDLIAYFEPDNSLRRALWHGVAAVGAVSVFLGAAFLKHNLVAAIIDKHPERADGFLLNNRDFTAVTRNMSYSMGVPQVDVTAFAANPSASGKKKKKPSRPDERVASPPQQLLWTALSAPSDNQLF